MLYRTTLRRLAINASKRPSTTSSFLQQYPKVAPLSTHARPRSLASRSVVFLRPSTAIRFYATRSRGTQTGSSTKPKGTPKTKSTKGKATKTKKKKPAKKAAKKTARKPKAQPTPEAKLATKVRALKAEALLAEPKYKATSVWSLILSEPGQGQAVSREAMTTRKNRYASLSASERQTYTTEAEANKRSNAILKRQFVESHTPFQVYRANIARNALRRISRQPKPAGRTRALVARKGYTALVDERVPKRPLTSYLQFVTEQRSGGDLGGSTLPEQAVEAKRGWQSLSPSEKKRYTDIYAFQKDEYDRKMRAVMPERYQKRSRSASV